MGQGLNRLGMMSDGEPEQMTLRILGWDALTKVAPLSPAEIVEVREQQNTRTANLTK